MSITIDEGSGWLRNATIREDDDGVLAIVLRRDGTGGGVYGCIFQTNNVRVYSEDTLIFDRGTIVTPHIAVEMDGAASEGEG